MIDFPPMDRKAISIVPLEQAGDDRVYWSTKSLEERLAALELMRQVLYGFDPAVARLQRVLEVAECEWR